MSESKKGSAYKPPATPDAWATPGEDAAAATGTAAVAKAAETERTSKGTPRSTGSRGSRGRKREKAASKKKDAGDAGGDMAPDAPDEERTGEQAKTPHGFTVSEMGEAAVDGEHASKVAAEFTKEQRRVRSRERRRSRVGGAITVGVQPLVGAGGGGAARRRSLVGFGGVPSTGPSRESTATGGRRRRRSSVVGLGAADEVADEDEASRPEDWKDKLKRRVQKGKESGILDLSTALTGAEFRFELSTIPQHLIDTFLSVPDGKQKLVQLWASNNLIDRLPMRLRKLTTLRVLSLSNNNLTEIPPCVGELVGLERLMLANNMIVLVPESMHRLQHLQELRLDGNQITRFPPVVTRLRRLTQLGMSWNEITSVPAEIRRLGSLVELALDGNHIGPEVPKELLRLSSLRILGLSYNWLEKVPEFEKVPYAPTLSVVRIEGNRSGSYKVHHESGMVLEGVNIKSRFDGYLELRTAQLEVHADGSNVRVEKELEGYLKESVEYNNRNANWAHPERSDARQVLRARARRVTWRTTNRVADTDVTSRDAPAKIVFDD